MSVNKEKLLQKNIGELPFSKAIKEKLEDEGIPNLAVLLQWPIYQWQKRIHGLTFPQVCEIVHFAIAQGLGECLKEE